MSNIQINVNSIGLDTNYPVAGTNNSTQGFRTNFAAIQTGFETATSEVSKLQNTKLSFSGDLSGSSQVLDLASQTGSNWTLNSQITLNTVLSGGATLDPNSLYQLIVDEKGRITTVTQVDPMISWGDFGPTSPIAPTSTNMGTGSGTIGFPTLTFNSVGRLVAATKTNITWGLLNQTLQKGSLIVGNSSNLSVTTSGPQDGADYTIISNNGNISWIPSTSLAAQLTFAAGPAIKLTQTGSQIQYGVDLTNLTSSVPDFTGTILVQDGLGTINKSTIQQLASRISVLSLDTTPSLSGNLTTNDFLIKSANSINSVGVKNSSLDLTGTVKINGSAWPTVNPTDGWVLTYNNGDLVWNAPGLVDLMVANTIHIADWGLDSNPGSRNRPLKTLNAAINQMNSDTNLVIDGTFQEDVGVNNLNTLTITAYNPSNKPVIKGHLTIQNTNTVLLANIIWDLENQPSNDATPALETTGNITTFRANNCEWRRALTGNVITLGSQTAGSFQIKNCNIGGDATIQTAGETIITNWVGDVHFTINEGTTTLNNGEGSVEINGGTTTIENCQLHEWSSTTTTNLNFPLYSGADPLFQTLAGGADTIASGTPLKTGPLTILLDSEGLPVPDGDLYVTTNYIQEYAPVLTTRTITSSIINRANTTTIVKNSTSTGTGWWGPDATLEEYQYTRLKANDVGVTTNIQTISTNGRIQLQRIDGILALDVQGPTTIDWVGDDYRETTLLINNPLNYELIQRPIINWANTGRGTYWRTLKGTNPATLTGDKFYITKNPQTSNLPHMTFATFDPNQTFAFEKVDVGTTLTLRGTNLTMTRSQGVNIQASGNILNGKAQATAIDFNTWLIEGDLTGSWTLDTSSTLTTTDSTQTLE